MKTLQDNGENTITRAQQIFIDKMIAGCSQMEAYSYAYPDAGPTTWYSSASRLMTRPSIQKRIDDGIAQLRMKYYEKEKNAMLKKLNSIKDKRDALQAIIEGRSVNKTTIVNEDTGATIVKLREDPMLTIHAIKLDLKLEEIQEKLQQDIKIAIGDDAWYLLEEELNHTASAPPPANEINGHPGSSQNPINPGSGSKNKKPEKPYQTLTSNDTQPGSSLNPINPGSNPGSSTNEESRSTKLRQNMI